jgi:hypothetical protein
MGIDWLFGCLVILIFPIYPPAIFVLFMPLSSLVEDEALQ